MTFSPYIPFIVLFILVVGSLFSSENREAARFMTILLVINALMIPWQINTEASKDLTPDFAIFFLVLSFSFLFLIFYNSNNKKIFLKLALVNVALGGVHILYIMSFIEEFNTAQWYLSSGLLFFYFKYNILQICLTIYMIILFGQSGIKGISNGLDKLFKPNPSRHYTNGVHNFHGVVVSSSDRHCKENKIHKKGI